MLLPKSKLANEAVATLLVINVSKCDGIKLFVLIYSEIQAIKEAKNPITIDCN
jgi:hypothetical protein